MNNSARVGEIFQTAGAAFNKLGELTMQLNGVGGAAGGAKWTEKEIMMLQTAVNNFALEINTISEIMKNKTVNQIKGALQKKAFDDAGIVLQQVPSAHSKMVNQSTLSSNKARSPTQTLNQRTSPQITMMETESETVKTSMEEASQVSTESSNPQQPANQQTTTLSTPSGSGVIPVTPVTAEGSDDKAQISSASDEGILSTTGNANSNVTLNMLNASENEVDVEGLGPPSNNTLDFGSSN